MALEQWVNIRKDAKWVEDEVTSIRRLGAIRFKAKFKDAVLSAFLIRVVITKDDAKYSKAEKKRNKNFRILFGRGAANNAGATEIELQRDVFLPQAGGVEYKCEAKHKEKVVQSDTFVVRRRLFYQSCKMKGLPGGSLAGMETEYWAPRKYFIKLKKKADGEMTFIKCLWDDDGRPRGGSYVDNDAYFQQEAKKAWKLAGRMPYAFMLIWVNYIASMGMETITQSVAFGIPSKLWSWRWAGNSFEFTTTDYLWDGLDDGHDATNYWLDDITVHFVDKAGKDTDLAIPKDRVSIIKADASGDTKEHTFGGYKRIKVDLSAADMAGLRNRFTKNEGSLEFVIKVRVAVGFTGGFSYNGINVITVSDKAWWDPNDATNKEYVLNHEFGHKIGMVADGTGRAPTKPGTHYTGQTHVGNHCSNGATFTAATSTWSGAPICVMFGANATSAGYAPPTFCGNCEPIVRKLDLLPPLPGFARTIG